MLRVLLLLNGLKLHHVFCNQHLAGKMFLPLLGPWRVIVSTDTLGQVRQHQGLDVGACRHLSHDLEAHMSLGGLPLRARLLLSESSFASGRFRSFVASDP